MKLAQIRESFQDNTFAMMYYNPEAKDSLITAHIIHPKEVKIKEDLTVWDAKKVHVLSMECKIKIILLLHHLLKNLKLK